MRKAMWIVGMALALLAGGVCATDTGEPIYGGCVDARGAAVPALSDDQLPAVVATGVEAGRAVIRYNPAALPRLLPVTRSFLFAQACARINLGYPALGELDADQARRADCAAADSLRRSGLLAAGAQPALEADLKLAEDEWAWVSGPRRGFALDACPSGSGRGLYGEPAAGQPGWNACVRACAAPLYRCQARCAAGRCADCESAYASCIAGCGAP